MWTEACRPTHADRGLHAVLCLLIEGGTGWHLNVARATNLLAGVAIGDPIMVERVATCTQFVTEIAFLDAALADTRARTVAAVTASKTSVTDVYGVGPIGAAIIVGRSGDIRRFPTGGHFARHNGTAPLEASSGPKARHRLNLEGIASSTTPSTPPRSPRSPTTPRPHLLRTQAGRGQDPQRSAACSQAMHQRRRLPTADQRHSLRNNPTGPATELTVDVADIAGPGGQRGDDSPSPA
jgi:Transposase IS116/IS110/IS902 family